MFIKRIILTTHLALFTVLFAPSASAICPAVSGQTCTLDCSGASSSRIACPNKIDEPSNTSCVVTFQKADGGFEIINTTYFRFPEGMIVSESRTSVQPAADDGSGRAIFITGEIADEPNIIRGTKAFRGATGNSRLSGIVDMTDFDIGIVSFDCIFIIDLNGENGA